MKHIRNGGHRAVLIISIATLLSLLWGGVADRTGAARPGSLVPLCAPGPAAEPVAQSLDRAPANPGAAEGPSDRGDASRQTAPTRAAVRAGRHETGARERIPAATPALRDRIALAATGPGGAAQPSCGYLLSPTYEAFPSEGGQGSLSVTTSGRCFWKAVSRVPWIVLVSGASGAGNGVVTYRVLPNKAVSRSGTVTIADQTLTIRQSAAPCCETST